MNPQTKEKIPVTEDYIDRKQLPDGFAGAYWTEAGVEDTEKPIISEVTYIEKGKNVKSKNFTTSFTQAILDARSDYNKRIRKGNVTEKELLNVADKIVTFDDLIKQVHRGSKPWRVFMMALHDVEKNKNWRHVKYPCKIQCKLDGTAFIVVYHPGLPEIELHTESGKPRKVRMDGYTRGRESYGGQDHILYELYPVLKKYPGLHLVGELWKPGYGLQDISGSSRRQLDSKIKTEAIKLDFNIFDCFYIDRPELTFVEREAIVDDIVSELENENEYIKQIPSYEVENKEQLLNKYESFLMDKKEGAVIRNLDSRHEVGIDKEKRSYQTLKLKPRPDAEWPVINFKEGVVGKEKGAVIWICCENDEGVRERLKIKPDDPLPKLEERKKFSVPPKMDYETRYKIFEALAENPNLFEEKLKGKLITVSYSILSKDLLPQQPKALRFRDPGVNEWILNL